MPIVSNIPVRSGLCRRARALDDGAAPERFVIFAPGDNPGDDGEAIFDDKAAKAVMAEYRKRGVLRLTIDYNHKSIDREARPEDQKAAGWFTPKIVRDQYGRPWLYAESVKWTEAARKGIEAKEWLYISPVFTKDDNGRVLSIVNLAITNNPATWGARPLVAASTTGAGAPQRGEKMEPNMMQELAKLLNCLARLATSNDAQWQNWGVQQVAAVKDMLGEEQYAAVEALSDELAGGEGAAEDATEGPASERAKRAEEIQTAPAEEMRAEEVKPEEQRALRTLTPAQALAVERLIAKRTAKQVSSTVGRAAKIAKLPVYMRSAAASWSDKDIDSVIASLPQARTAPKNAVRPARAATTDATARNIDPQTLKIAARTSGIDPKKIEERIRKNREEQAALAAQK